MDINSSSDEDSIIEGLVSGNLKFYKLDESLGDYARASRIRYKAIKKILGLKLDHIGKCTLSPENCKPNIENMIGAVQIPLGFAGPLKVAGEFAVGNFFIPVATTEGSLTASINRGCSAINASGGAKVVVLKNAQTRSLLFKADDISSIKRLYDWIEKNIDGIKVVAEKKSRFLEFKDYDIFVVGNNLWLRISADTKDAMGMNMISIAGDAVGKYIVDNVDGIEFISVSGNACIDKKPSALTLTQGRGKSVVAECILKRGVITKYLKTTPESLVDVNYRKNMLGSAVSGSFGYNAHFANIIAAVFLATGQDIAHVVEGSHGFTSMEMIGDDLLMTVTIPSLQVGTVGGGTRVETQKECLQILGVEGPGDPPGINSLKLAEIIAASVLAGELSLLAALSAHHLSKAHMRFNR